MFVHSFFVFYMTIGRVLAKWPARKQLEKPVQKMARVSDPRQILGLLRETQHSDALSDDGPLLELIDNNQVVFFAPIGAGSTSDPETGPDKSAHSKMIQDNLVVYVLIGVDSPSDPETGPDHK